jgi:hypothetical protein
MVVILSAAKAESAEPKRSEDATPSCLGRKPATSYLRPQISVVSHDSRTETLRFAQGDRAAGGKGISVTGH